jgi:endonuclease G
MFTFWRRGAAALAVCVLLGAPGSGRAAEGDEHLVMGNPSGATADKTRRNNFLIQRRQYALSYNNSRGTPNWVSWQLSKKWLGRTGRRDAFAPDTSLPEGFLVVRPNDYRGSGFDKGHLCPAADRSVSREDMDATFLMTNMVPQSPDDNRNTWEKLEEYCREQVRRNDKELYIVAGPAGRGGFGSDGYRTFLRSGKGKIVVPGKTWKVALIVPAGVNNPKKVTAEARVVAVITPNIQGLAHDWRKYRVSVNDVEELTGYTFFGNLRPEVAKELKARKGDVQAKPPVVVKKPSPRKEGKEDKAKAKEEFAKAVKASRKAKVVRVDHDKHVLSLKSGGKTASYTVTTDTKFYGPQGGHARLTDKRLKAGAEVQIVADGKTLKALILPSARRKRR